MAGHSKSHRKKALPPKQVRKSTIWVERSAGDIENAEESVREGINKTGGTVREGFTKTRESVQGMGVLSRVYGRLHWDKSLNSSSLFVKAEAGAVTLRGSVADEAARDQGRRSRQGYGRSDPRDRSTHRALHSTKTTIAPPSVDVRLRTVVVNWGVSGVFRTSLYMSQ